MTRIAQYSGWAAILVLQSRNAYAAHSIGSGIEFFFVLLAVLIAGAVCLVLGILKVRSIKKKKGRGALDVAILLLLSMPVVLALGVLVLLLSLFIKAG